MNFHEYRIEQGGNFCDFNSPYHAPPYSDVSFSPSLQLTELKEIACFHCNVMWTISIHSLLALTLVMEYIASRVIFVTS